MVRYVVHPTSIVRYRWKAAQYLSQSKILWVFNLKPLTASRQGTILFVLSPVAQTHMYQENISKVRLGLRWLGVILTLRRENSQVRNHGHPKPLASLHPSKDCQTIRQNGHHACKWRLQHHGIDLPKPVSGQQQPPAVHPR